MTDKRILQFVEATRAMATGEFGVVVPADGGDEVGQLGQALNQLAVSLSGRFEELNRLATLTERLNAELLLEDVLDHVFESFQDLIPFDRVGFALLDEDGQRARAIWARSVAPSLALDAGYSAPLEGSSLATILATGKPRIINDLEAYLAEHPDSESTRRILAEGIRSNLTCPLVAMGQRIGFIFFSSCQTDTYATVHLTLFERIAGQLSLIIEKGRLYQELLRAKHELEVANKKLQRLAALDGLTGIPNRRAFDQRLDMEWRRALRDGTPLAVIFIDIDHFKRLNDASGHLVGDDCLRSVARALSDALRRAHDFVGRYGGEEFGAILANTDAEAAVRTAEMLRGVVESLAIPHPDSPVGPHVTVSLGVATLIPSPSAAPGDLLEVADDVLYRAKSAGRNVVATASLDEPTTDPVPRKGAAPDAHQA